MTREHRDEFLKILHAHAQTIDICEACAELTAVRDEVRRLLIEFS